MTMTSLFIGLICGALGWWGRGVWDAWREGRPMFTPNRWNAAKDFAFFVALTIMIWSAFVATKASHRADDAADNAQQTSDCSVQILGRLLDAQNQARKSGNHARVAETLAKQKLVDVLTISLQKPPPDKEESRKIVRDWLAAAQADVDAAHSVGSTIDNYPLPTRKQLLTCVSNNTE